MYEGVDDDAKQKKSDLRKTLLRMRNEVNINKKFPDSSLNEFVEASIFLNSLLPPLSDPSLTSIDDLLYDDDDDDEVHDGRPEVASNFFRLYHPIYFHYVTRPGSSKRILDLTYLKFVKAVSSSIFKLHMETYKVFATVVVLISSRCTDKVCQGLKLLKVGLDKHKFYMVEHMRHKLNLAMHTMSWLGDLSNIPQAKDDKKKLITSWLSLNAKAVTEILVKELDFKLLMGKLDNFNEQLGGNFIHVLLKELWPSVYTSINNPYFGPIAHYHDRLLRYFLSATNEGSKREKLRVFLRGCYLYNLDARNDIALSLEQNKTSSYLSSLTHVTELLNDCIEHIIKSLGTANEGMQDIATCPSYRFGPYLSDSFDTETFPVDSSGQEDTESSKDLQNLGDNNYLPDETDFTVEKYLYFDDFMKYLKLLSIFHEAIEKAEELLGTTGGMEGFDTEAVRRNGNVKNYFIDILINPSKRGKVPWMMKLMLDKCPFLILNPRHEYMVKDLRRMIQGEVVDEVTEERIYFTLNFAINS